MIARVGCENRHPSHEAPARLLEKIKTYIVARDYGDDHQLTRFVQVTATPHDLSGRASDSPQMVIVEVPAARIERYREQW
jgi:hypothetical protein